MGRLSAICLIAAAACGRSGFNDYTPIDGAPHTGDGHAAGDAASGDTPSTGDAGADGPLGSQVAFVGSPIQHTGPMGSSDSVAFQATNAGDAIALMVACAGSQVPSAVTITAPGWSFFQLAPVTVNSTGQVYAAAFGAIAPSTAMTTLAIMWTGANCNRGQSALADEFGNNDKTGSSTTFDATSANSGAGNCTTTITTAHDGDAVWSGCYAATALTGPGTGYTKAAADTVGDFTEYKLTGDPANTIETVTFANPNGFVIVAATIKPI